MEKKPENLLSQKIGTKLRAIRQMLNLTQEGMAELLEMSVSGYAKIERGESDINLSRIDDFASRLDLNSTELLNFGEKFILNNSNPEGINNHRTSQHDKQEIEILKTAVLDLKNEVESLKRRLDKLEGEES